VGTWSELLRAEPAIAEAGRALLYQHGVGLGYLSQRSVWMEAPVSIRSARYSSKIVYLRSSSPHRNRGTFAETAGMRCIRSRASTTKMPSS
jgi:hypothetical protein